MPREEIIKEVSNLLSGVYYEDLEFFYKLIARYTEKVRNK